MRSLLKISALFSAFLIMLCSSMAQNAVPVVTNISALADTVDNVLRVSYDLADTENEDCEVWLLVMSNDTSYTVSTNGAFGDLGFPISVGTNKLIVWDYGPNHPNILNYNIRVVADDQFQIDIQSVVDQVDTMNLYNDLTWVQGIRHPTADSAHWHAVRDSMGALFTSLNLETEMWGFEYQNINATNVIGWKPGCVNQASTYIVDAHYDGVFDAPAADDNGSGVVGVWECARILSQYDFKNNIRFIGFDLEEYGLIGSARYVNDGGIKNWETIDGVLNYEMIGYFRSDDSSQIFPNGFDQLFPAAYDSMVAANWKGNFLANVANVPSSDLKTTFDTCALAYVPDLRVISLETPGTGIFTPDLRRSDHAKFWDRGIPALMLTDAADFRNLNYHSPDDVLDSLDFRFMGNNVKATIATLCVLGEIQHCGKGNGTVSVDPMSSVGELNAVISGLKVYPVPASDFITVEPVNIKASKVKWTITDLTGKVVASKTNVSSKAPLQLDVSQFAPGWYSISMETKSQVEVARFLVE